MMRRTSSFIGRSAGWLDLCTYYQLSGALHELPAEWHFARTTGWVALWMNYRLSGALHELPAEWRFAWTTDWVALLHELPTEWRFAWTTGWVALCMNYRLSGALRGLPECLRKAIAARLWALLLCILDVRSWNTARRPTILTDGFRPSKSFKTRYSFIMFSFDAL